MPTNELYELLQQLTAKIQQLEEKEESYTTGLLKFTQKEISQMPKTFRKEFRIQGCVTHIRKRSDKRYKCSYEIRYRRNGYNISVSATTIEEAKKRFIEILNKPKTQNNEIDKIPKTFNEFATYYFNTFRKRKVTEKTFYNDLKRYNLYILPEFGSTPIKMITSARCQKILDEINAAGKGKTYEEIYSLLNIIFKMAIKHDIITRNPLDIVFKEKHIRNHGKALSKSEERENAVFLNFEFYKLEFFLYFILSFSLMLFISFNNFFVKWRFLCIFPPNISKIHIGVKPRFFTSGKVYYLWMFLILFV